MIIAIYMTSCAGNCVIELAKLKKENAFAQILGQENHLPECGYLKVEKEGFTMTYHWPTFCTEP